MAHEFAEFIEPVYFVACLGVAGVGDCLNRIRYFEKGVCVDAQVEEKGIHWSYFLALERDLEVVSRYVEFSGKNYSVYSIELAHLLFAAASEVDVLAKLLCNLIQPGSRQKNIDQYRKTLQPAIADLPRIGVFVPRYGLEFCPWLNWAEERSPDWWRSYNNVKHERNSHFHEATLENVLNAMGALLIMIAHYYAQLLQSGDANCIMQKLKPNSSLLRLNNKYYHAW